MHESADEGTPGRLPILRAPETPGQGHVKFTGNDRGHHIGSITGDCMMERGRKDGFAEETIPTD